MNIEWYRTYITLAKYLNYRKVSEIMFISPPSLFTQIKKLETELNVKLFEKNGRNIILTSQGEEFLPLAKDVVKSFDNSINLMRQNNNSKQVVLKICLSEYSGTYLLQDVFTLFMNKNPNINIHITTMSEDRMNNAFFDDKWDIIISRNYFSVDNIKNIAINKCAVRLVVPTSSYTIAKNEKDYFSEYKRIILENNLYISTTTLKHTILNMHSDVKFMAINNIRIAINMIVNGRAVGYLPVNTITDDINRKIKIVDSKQITPILSTTYVSYISNSLYVMNFIKFITKRYIIDE